MKVFGTGLQRTGTTSLSRALRMLGINTLDCPKELHYDLSHPVTQEFDAFTDNPVPLLYRELDRLYPGSKFVHTQRAESDWLHSVQWLFTVGAEKFHWKDHPEYHEFHRELYGTAEFDPEVFAATYQQHNRDVRDYFADRPDDLLIMDVSRGDGFDKLCPFLGKSLPDAEFPHFNKRDRLWAMRFKKVVRKFLPKRPAAT